MWSLNDVHSFVINLDRRPDRWEQVQAQPDAHRIPNLSRFSAVDGKTLNLQTDSRVSTYARHNITYSLRRSHDMLDSIGGVGCALSHVSLWEKLAKSDAPVILILEDDIALPSGTWARVEKVFETSPFLRNTENWDIWSIGNLNCLPTRGHNEIPRDGNPSRNESEWIQCREFVGLQAYFITRRGAMKLLKEAYPIQQHIDWFISYYAATRPFTIVHNRYINIQQNQANSDIAMKSQCVICDFPTNVEDTYFVISKRTLDLTLIGVTMALLGAVLVKKALK